MKEIEMKCSVCRRRFARYRVRNAYQQSANGKFVCNSNVCWGQVTGGYPAEGVRIPDSTTRS